jgi:hypothetical protein
MKLSLEAKQICWVCLVLSFPERFQPITAAAVMCTVTINVLEPGAFNPTSQYFIALFNKISWLYKQKPRMNVTSIEGCNSGVIGRDFMDNSSVSTSRIKNSTMSVPGTKINENIITTTWGEDHGNLGYYCICNEHNLNQLWHTCISKPTSKFNTETIYVCYIVVKFYVFVYTNIIYFSIFMYNYNAIFIFLSWILHTHNYVKTFEN